MTHLSLFSGIGGLDLAAEWAGFTTVGQCEFADYPTKVLEKHWPKVPRWRDIRTLTGGDFYERTGLRTVDVVSGGFPCQPFSVAGKRRGREDDRFLWPEMCRVIAQFKPTWVIGENVAGIVSMAEPDGKPYVESRTINRFEDQDYYEAVLSQRERMLLVGIIEDLEQIGYEVQPFIIPACGVGAPHRRDRIAVIAYADRDSRRKRWPKPKKQQRQAGAANGGPAMADTNSRTMRNDRDNGRPTDREVDASDYASNAGGTIMDNPNGGRQPRDNRRWQQPQFADGCWRSIKPGLGRMADGFTDRLDGYWENEPNIPRIAKGVAYRIERLKGLGNMVVPQQFYPIFAAIAEIEQYA